MGGSRGKVRRQAPPPAADEAGGTVADELAKKQREISISEFFAKNRHLLGFDNPRKALLTTIKEAVDNSLDACEEARILPEVKVRVEELKGGRLRVTVRDNGPGIVRKQIPRIFGKLLYGSKFHTRKMARGQQGIGISAAGMHGQLTTGKPVRIVSRTGSGRPAHYYEVLIDTRRNEPRVVKEEDTTWDCRRGTEVSIDMTARYQKGRQSVDHYLELTAIANPHVTLSYELPGGEPVTFPRKVKEIPREPREIKPHPYGVELGVLIRMLHDTRARTLQAFLAQDFSRVSSRTAKEICRRAKLYEKARPTRIARQEADALYQAINETKLMAPPTDCIIPIGEIQVRKGLSRGVEAGFIAAVTRSPSVYRGNPFVIEAGIAYGGDLPEDQTVSLLRFANRVPLLYQAGACAITQAVQSVDWRGYGLSQSRGGLPAGPAVIMVHLASVWVPFTSESKEAVADYPEINKEMRLALQECGRRLQAYVRKRKRFELERKRKAIFDLYIDELTAAVGDITRVNRERFRRDLRKIARQITVGENGD